MRDGHHHDLVGAVIVGDRFELLPHGVGCADGPSALALELGGHARMISKKRDRFIDGRNGTRPTLQKERERETGAGGEALCFRVGLRRDDVHTHHGVWVAQRFRGPETRPVLLERGHQVVGREM